MQINEELESPQIIIQVYPMEAELVGILTVNQTLTYLQYMSSLYTETQLEGMTNVHMLQLSPVDLPLTGECAFHLTAAADANIAVQLSAYIEAVLPEWTRSTYPLSVEV